MMSTRTPKSGRLLLAAACGMFLVSPTDAQESTDGWTARLNHERIESLRRERRILLAAYNDDLNRATAEVDRAARVAPTPSIEATESAETESAETESAETESAEAAADVAVEPKPLVEAPVQVQVAQTRYRRNAGRSSMRRDWMSRRRQFGSNSPEPAIEPPTVPDTEPADDPVVADTEPVEDAVAPSGDDEGRVSEAKASGDVEPNRLPAAVTVEEPKREKRSLLSRIFGRKKKTPEPAVAEPMPEDSEIEDAVAGPTEPSAPAEEAPVVPPAPSELADNEEPRANEFDLPEPMDTDEGEALPMPPLPEENVADAQPATDELDNPFPELSENEADAGEENPFGAIDEPADTDPAPMPEENPFEVEEPEPARIAEETPAEEKPEDLVIEPMPMPGEAPVIEPRRVANTPAETAPPAPAEAAASPAPAEVARAADVDPRIRRIQQRQGLTGLKGFCPVALRDDRQLVDAQPEYAVVHKARTYHLSSRDALQRFEADPEKYAPVASGHDVILLTVEGRRIEGSLDHAVWYKDRLHLFSSRETLSRFVSSLNRDPFGGSNRPVSNEVRSTEREPIEDAVIEESNGPSIQLPAPSDDENPFEDSEDNPFE